MSLGFEWDDDKAATNIVKHQVTFEEAATVFADPLAVIFDDEAHSAEETHELILGHSTSNHLLLVSFTERNGVVRIISAAGNGEIMKIPPDNHEPSANDDLLPEYDFDYSQAGPSRFAAKVAPGSRIVTLGPDVAEVFTTPEAVNKVLRALSDTMLQTVH